MFPLNFRRVDSGQHGKERMTIISIILLPCVPIQKTASSLWCACNMAARRHVTRGFYMNAWLGLGSVNWHLVLGSAIASSIVSTSAALAQIQALPPPPSIPNLPTAPGMNGLPPLTPIPMVQGAQPVVVSPTGYPQPNFSGVTYPVPAGYPVMPQSAIAQPQAQPQIAQPQTAYTVVVNGDSPYLLQLIQQMEPAATLQDYKGRQVIQAGVFPSERDAMQRIAFFQQQGIAAQVVPVSLGYQTPTAMRANGMPMVSQPKKSPHFEVVVPTGSENFGMVTNKLMSMGVKPEAIQAKQVPLGPHVAVGPFSEINEARSVSSYLRTGGLDARVYYAK
jgi:hypothetical protein